GYAIVLASRGGVLDEWTELVIVDAVGNRFGSTVLDRHVCQLGVLHFALWVVAPQCLDEAHVCSWAFIRYASQCIGCTRGEVGCRTAIQVADVAVLNGDLAVSQPLLHLVAIGGFEVCT